MKCFHFTFQPFLFKSPCKPTIQPCNVALVSLSGAAAPTATVLSNNTGYTYTWARTGGGTYTFTASGNAFTVNKTIVFNNNGIDNGGGYTPPQWTRTSDTVITLTTGGIDTALDKGSFEVRIYS